MLFVCSNNLCESCDVQNCKVRSGVCCVTPRRENKTKCFSPPRLPPESEKRRKKGNRGREVREAGIFFECDAGLQQR